MSSKNILHDFLGSSAITLEEKSLGVFHLKGNSGSGKTTYFYNLLGLLDGQEKISAEFISSEINLFPDTVCNEWDRLGISKKSQIEYLQAIQVDHGFLVKKTGELSLGERQILINLRGFTSRKRYVFFDETFSNLDKIKRNLTMNFMAKKSRDENVIFVYTYHD